MELIGSKISEAGSKKGISMVVGTSCRQILGDSTGWSVKALNMLGHFLKVSNSWLMKHAPHRNYKVYPQGIPRCSRCCGAAKLCLKLMDKNLANKVFGKAHSPLQISSEKSPWNVSYRRLFPRKTLWGFCSSIPSTVPLGQHENALGGGQGVVVSCGNCCRP